MSRVIPKVA